MLHKFVLGVLIILGVHLMSACGQRGPLYLPNKNQPTDNQTSPLYGSFFLPE
jgi:predicted small lipoprotein YifL